MLRFVFELAARRRDVSSSTFPDDGVDVVLFQNTLEADDSVIGRPLKWQPFNFVPSQQVHRTPQATNHINQSVGMFRLVVDARQ